MIKEKICRMLFFGGSSSREKKKNFKENLGIMRRKKCSGINHKSKFYKKEINPISKE